MSPGILDASRIAYCDAHGSLRGRAEQPDETSNGSNPRGRGDGLALWKRKGSFFVAKSDVDPDGIFKTWAKPLRNLAKIRVLSPNTPEDKIL